MVKRTSYLIFGSLSLALGIVGIFLPLIPTTPLVLLAAYFYSRSSKVLHQKLLEHKLFGPMVKKWEKEGAIPLKIKWLSSIMMVVMISYPVFMKSLPMWVDIGMIGVVLFGLGFIWTRPTSREQ